MPNNDFDIDDLLGESSTSNKPKQRRTISSQQRPISRMQSSGQSGSTNKLNARSSAGEKVLKQEGKSAPKKLNNTKPVQVTEASQESKEKKIPPNPKPEKKVESITNTKPLFTWYKILFAVIIGLSMVGLIFVVTGVWYTNNLRYPPQQEIDYAQTGMCALEGYAEKVHNLEGIDESSYLPQEILYANSNKEIEDFMYKIASTVSYDSDVIDAKNIYGNNMIDKNTLEVVQEKSPVVEGEEISTFYVDYDAIDFNKAKIKQLMAEEELKLGDVDYQNRLVPIFVRYINGLSELPIKEVRRVPNIQKISVDMGEDLPPVDSYVVLPEEDIFFDTELFSSEEFYNCLDRFSSLAGDSVGTDIKRQGFSGWGRTAKVGSLPKVNEKNAVSFGSLQESQEYLDYMALSPEKQANMEKPARYGYKNTIVRDWCGAYYWANYVSPNEEEPGEVTPKLGNGTKEDPANFNTPVVTTMFDEEGNEIPIRVTLKEFGVSKKAIDWFENKDIQNRGFNLNSGVQYCYIVFDVTNLSDKEVTIKDNSSLCDVNANLSVRTGTLFGLQDSVTLAPDETGTIESWSRSTELYLKYVIWGADFERRAEPVWFRLLAGNKEDTSQYKMVHVEGSTEPEDGVEPGEDLESGVDTDETVSGLEDSLSSEPSSSSSSEGSVSSESSSSAG